VGKTANMLTPENYIRKKARSLPVYKCLVNKDWQDYGLADVWVCRQHINGNITAGFFLVDLLCLGVKNTFYFFNYPDYEFQERLERFSEPGDLIEIDYTLAHNIVYAGLEFAEEYGFKPHKDFLVSKYLLEEDNDEIELIDIECGTDGKPAVFKHPDNIAEVNRAIAILKKSAGPGNYIIHHVSEDDSQHTDNFDQDLKEKEQRFVELVTTIDKLTDNQRDEIFSLTSELFDQYIDEEVFDEIYADFERIFDLEIDDTYYEGLIGIPNLKKIDVNLILTEVSEIVTLAHLKSKIEKARKKLNRLIKLYGRIPLIEKMELFLLHEEGKDDELVHHIQALEKYPDYPMLKFQLYNRILAAPHDDFDNLLVDLDFSDLFQSRQKIHSSELVEFLLFRFNLAKKTIDLETIEAVFQVFLKLSENKDDKWTLAIIMILRYKMEFLSNDLIDEETSSDES